MRYFFHLYEAALRTIDPEGAEFLTPQAAIDYARLAIRRMLGLEIAETGDLWLGRRVDIADASGAIVRSIPFADAVRVLA